MSRKLDLRVYKTEKALEAAFFELLETTPFERITVADITGRALVGKGTFYNHYRDKYDLARSLIDARLEQYKVMLGERIRGLRGEAEETTTSGTLTSSSNAVVTAAETLLPQFRLLRRISTRELNFETEIKQFIANQFVEMMDSERIPTEQLHSVGRLLAALTLAYFDEYSDHIHHADQELQNTLLIEFDMALHAFILPARPAREREIPGGE